jgi:hypothetical protein
MKMKRKIKQILPACLMVICFIGLYRVGYAAEGDFDTSQITTPINNIYTLVASIISAIGSIITLLSVVSLFSAISAHDSTQQVTAILKVATGIGIAFAPWILKYVLGV